MDTLGVKRTLSSSLPDNFQPAASTDSNEARPAKCKRADAQAASQRHIKTEQARRDKISAGFQSLQQLLPGREKVEKAMLLTQAAEYISQLQGVLKLIMSSGALSKLPDELQFQIRTLLPRKDHAPIAAAAAAPAPAAPAAAQAPAVLPQMAATNLLTGGMQLPFMPLLPQVPELGKDLPKDEATLMAHVQVLLQQQQHAAAAAQQLQSFQQTLQAIQLQQVLQQQQGGQGVPEVLPNIGASSASQMAASLPLQLNMPARTSTEAPQENVQPTAPIARRPCFADELPKCGLQQLVDAACEPSLGGSRQSPTARQARKNVKVRRHTTAARIPKPETQQHPARAQGRPGPV